MASHSELRPDDAALPLLIASAALSKAESRLTVATGTVVADNADGTQTWIGANGSDDANGVIKWVGDLSAPGRPLGLSAACSMQCVVVSWDGTLENGVPSDFAYVEIFARREGSVDDVVSWGRLSSAGMLMSPRYDIGTVFDVYAIAYDDAHDSTGALARNRSEQSDLITVAVEQDADMEQIDAAVEEMSKKADEAGAKAEQVRKDMQSEVDDVRAKVDGLSSAGDRLSGQITDIKGTVNGQQTKLTEFGQKLEGEIARGDTTVKSVSELKQTVAGLSSTVSQTMKTASDALSKATTVEQTANGLKATLSKDYTSTKDADRKYSTKTELTTEAGRIRAELSETTKTANGAMDNSTALETTVNGISTKISEQATTLNATVKTANEAKSTADSNKQTISQVSQTASGALTKATTVEANLNSYKTTVSETYTSKTDTEALKKSTALCYTFKGAKGSPTWYKLGHLVSAGDASNIGLSVLTGNGYNGESAQNSQFEIYIKDGYQRTPSATKAFGVNVSRVRNADNVKVKVMASSATECDVWVYLPWAHWNGDYTLIGEYASWTDGAKTTGYISGSEPTSGTEQTGLAYDSISTQSYVKQTSKSVALGVVQDYKGEDGSGLATKTDISVSKTEITSEVSSKYATKDGVTKEIGSKITQNNSSWELKFETKQDSDSKISEVKASSMTGIRVEYALGASSTTAPASGWSTTAPAWVDGKYMWQRTVTQLGNGTSSTSDATCISGAQGPKGTTGQTGKGASGITPEYYLSTSNSTQSGGSWSATQSWSTGKYLWTRSKCAWTDGSVTYTTPVLADALNKANTAAADAQSRVGNLEPCIRMTSDGVRVGKQANGAYQGTSALVGTDGTFDVLDSSSKRLLEVGSSGVKFPKSSDGHQLALGYVTDSAAKADTLYIGDVVSGQQEGGPKNRLGFTGDEVSLEGGDISINANDNQLSLYGHKGANLLVPSGGNVQVGGQAGSSSTTLTLRGSAVNLYGDLVNVNGRTLNAPVDAKQSQRWDNIQLDVKCVNRVVTVNVLHPLGSNAVIGDQNDQCEIGYIKEGYRPSRMIGCHLAAYNTTNLFLEINPSTGKVACFRLWGNQNTWAYFSASLSYVI